MRLRALALAVLGGAILVPGAAGGSNLFVGATDDGFKSATEESVAVARDLGMTAFRITLWWEPGQRRMSASDAADFDRVVVAGYGMRIVAAVYGRARSAPRTPEAREAYCAYLGDMLTRYPTINDVVIWNEPNLNYFWQPQFEGHRSAAPADYALLLAKCWEALHAIRTEVNVITNTSPRGSDHFWASVNPSHSPSTFIRRMGQAYRANGRSLPIFDTVGHHAYGHSAERPWLEHLGPTHIAQGDWAKLMQTLYDAFHGTAQPIPGECAGSRCVSIWYLEAGYQTAPDPEKLELYTGDENDLHAVPDRADVRDTRARADSLAPDQATQVVDGIRLAYCQPYVDAFFNFLLRDEPDLGRWQSGVLWSDGTPKDSYPAFQQVIGEVNSGSVNCRRLKGGRPPAGFRPRTGVDVRLVEWPKRLVFPPTSRAWRFRIRTGESATYRAEVVRGTVEGSAVLSATGQLVLGTVEVVFPRVRLQRGSYRMRVVVTSVDAPERSTRLLSPSFAVG